MAYTVPNRPDTSSADLAEPDKGDFQSLGNRKSGVLSGGVVTRSASNTLSVTAVTGYLAGEYFSVSGPNSLDIVAPTSGSSKFVLVLVRKVGSTFTVVSQSTGGESATNAVYPALDDATELLLAVAYYPASATDIASSGIVDKRSFILPQANPTAVSSAPGAAVGAIGEIRVDSSLASPLNADGQSNVWIKTATDTWTNLAEYSTTIAAGGSDGDPATIAITGTVTGDAGTQATVENTGTATEAILKFTIPRGADGEDGQPGSTTAWNLQANSGASASIVANSTVNFVGDGDTTVSRSANTITITSTPTTSSYSFKVTEGAFSPQSTVESGGVLMIYGGNNIAVTRTGTYFTIDYDGPSPTPYSFKVTEGVFSPRHTVTNGETVVLYGGNDISVTRSGATFTISHTGSYLPLTAGTSKPLTGNLSTQNVIPSVHANYGLGTGTSRYATAWFDGYIYGPGITQPSDRSLKQSFGASPGLSFINELSPVSYEFKNAPGLHHWGFVADDVEAVCAANDLESTNTVRTVTEDGGLKYMNYTELTAPMVKAIQELSERLESIENG